MISQSEAGRSPSVPLRFGRCPARTLASPQYRMCGKVIGSWRGDWRPGTSSWTLVRGRRPGRPAPRMALIRSDRLVVDSLAPWPPLRHARDARSRRPRRAPTPTRCFTSPPCRSSPGRSTRWSPRPHFVEAWAYGTFFAVLAAFQLAWAVWIYARPSTPGFRIGAGRQRRRDRGVDRLANHRDAVWPGAVAGGVRRRARLGGDSRRGADRGPMRRLPGGRNLASERQMAAGALPRPPPGRDGGDVLRPAQPPARRRPSLR